MVVLDTDKITVNETIPYITGWNQGIDKIKNIFHKSKCQSFVFLVNQDKQYGLNQTKKIVKLFCGQST